MTVKPFQLFSPIAFHRSFFCSFVSHGFVRWWIRGELLWLLHLCLFSSVATVIARAPLWFGCSYSLANHDWSSSRVLGGGGICIYIKISVNRLRVKFSAMWVFRVCLTVCIKEKLTSRRLYKDSKDTLSHCVLLLPPFSFICESQRPKLEWKRSRVLWVRRVFYFRNDLFSVWGCRIVALKDVEGEKENHHVALD